VSKVTELAEAEAARAEAELGTSEPEPGEPEPGEPEPTEPEPGEPEPEEEEEAAADEPESAEPEAQGAPSGEQIASFERQVGKHELALKRIMGADFRYFVPCPTCDGVGHVPGLVPETAELEHDPATEPCPVCKGYGDVTTGSKKENYEARPCGNCGGGGFITRSAPAPAPYLQPAPVAAADNGEPVAPPGYVLVKTG
jgi:DnaJ-class molecular chaperone